MEGLSINLVYIKTTQQKKNANQSQLNLCQTEIFAIAEQQATAVESSKSNSHMRILAPYLSAHRSRPRSCRCLKSLMWREQSIRSKQRGRQKNAWTDFYKYCASWWGSMKMACWRHCFLTYCPGCHQDPGPWGDPSSEWLHPSVHAPAWRWGLRWSRHCTWSALLGQRICGRVKVFEVTWSTRQQDN